MTCPTMMRAVLLLLAALLAGCSDSQDDATGSTNADEPATAAGVVKPDTQLSDAAIRGSTTRPKAVFVEVVFEIADASITSAVPPVEPTARLEEGYFLNRIGPDMLRLFPAIGKPPDEKAFLWVGSRSHNYLVHGGQQRRSLRVAEGDHYVLEATRGEEGWSDPLADLYVDKIELSVDEDRVLTVRAAGDVVTLDPGQSRAVVSKHLGLDRATWADAIIVAMKEATGKAPRREDVLAQLDGAFPGRGPISLFSRTSIIYHGDVAVSGFDALDQWRLAQRAAAEGPYEDAEEALDRVLEAVPLSSQAAHLLERITKLLESGAKPARIAGTLKFSGGMPTEQHKVMWKESGAGFALLARPEAPQGSGFASVPIKDGSFTFSVPTGTYRLTVLVTGFSTLEKTIELTGDQVVVIEPQP